MAESTTTDANADPSKEETIETKIKDTVSYETHARLLDEKKKLAFKLKEIEDAKKIQFEKELKDKEDYKKIIELRDKEVVEYKTKYETLEARLTNGSKLSAVLDQIDGKVEKIYYGLIDLDSIALDPSTGMPDEKSVRDVAKQFSKTHSKVILKDGAASKMPHDAARGGSGGKLSLAEWTALPQNEKGKRMKDVDPNEYLT